ncbi:hypothetical protein K2Y11_07890 [bacterium]|nr:hypothetical protein [bacterium]
MLVFQSIFSVYIFNSYLSETRFRPHLLSTSWVLLVSAVTVSTYVLIPVIFLIRCRYFSSSPVQPRIPKWTDAPVQPSSELVILDFLGWAGLLIGGIFLGSSLSRNPVPPLNDFLIVMGMMIFVGGALMLATIRVGVWLIAKIDNKQEEK